MKLPGRASGTIQYDSRHLSAVRQASRGPFRREEELFIEDATLDGTQWERIRRNGTFVGRQIVDDVGLRIVGQKTFEWQLLERPWSSHI
jgi:hypothetical protein